MGRPRQQAGRSPPARANMAPRNTAVNFSPPPPPPPPPLPPPPPPPPAPRSPRIREQKLQASRLRRTAPIFPRSALSPAGRRRGAVPPLPLHAARRAGRRGGGPGSGEGRPPSPPSRPLAPPRRSGTERSPACRPPRRCRGRSPSTLRSLARPASASAGRAQAQGYSPPPSLLLLLPRPGLAPAPRRARPPGSALPPHRPPSQAGSERAGRGRRARKRRRAGERLAARRAAPPRAGRGARAGARGPRAPVGRARGRTGGAGRRRRIPAGLFTRVVSHARLRRLFGCDAVVGATPAREGRDYFQSQSGGGCTKAAAPLRPQVRAARPRSPSVPFGRCTAAVPE